MKRRFFLLLSGMLISWAVQAENTPLAVLLRGLDAPVFWTKVHAAEYLLELGLERPRVQKTFFTLEAHSQKLKFDRVGQHRVMIRLGNQIASREAELLQIALDKDAPDRVHAIETIGKLSSLVSSEKQAKMEPLWSDPHQPDFVRVFAAWTPAHDNIAREACLEEFLDMKYAQTTLPVCSMGGLAFFSALSPETLATLDSIFHSSLYTPVARISAAELLLKHGKIDFPQVQALWESSRHQREDTKAYCRILASIPLSKKNQGLLRQMLENENLEIAMDAAFALLKNEPEK